MDTREHDGHSPPGRVRMLPEQILPGRDVPDNHTSTLAAAVPVPSLPEHSRQPHLPDAVLSAMRLEREDHARNHHVPVYDRLLAADSRRAAHERPGATDRTLHGRYARAGVRLGDGQHYRVAGRYHDTLPDDGANSTSTAFRIIV